MTQSRSARVLRKGRAHRFTRVPGYVFERLGSSEALEILRVTVQPGSTTDRFTHAGEEWHLVLEGELEVEVDGEVCTLSEGDSVWHRSDKPHRWRNAGHREVVVLSVASPRTWLSTVMDLEHG